MRNWRCKLGREWTTRPTSFLVDHRSSTWTTLQRISSPSDQSLSRQLHVKCTQAHFPQPPYFLWKHTDAKSHRGLPCDIEARGIFREDLDSIELNFDIEARMKNGQSAKLLAVKDNMCDWATVTQGHNRASCPPRKGAGTISWSVALVQGWIMEVSRSLTLVRDLMRTLMTWLW